MKQDETLNVLTDFLNGKESFYIIFKKIFYLHKLTGSFGKPRLTGRQTLKRLIKILFSSGNPRLKSWAANNQLTILTVSTVFK